MNEEDRINGFLVELGHLSEKWRITIGGCGCCGSPYLDLHLKEEPRGYYVMKKGKDERLTWKKRE